MPFYGYNRPGPRFRRACAIVLAAGDDGRLAASYFCIKAFSETDLPKT